MSVSGPQQRGIVLAAGTAVAIQNASCSGGTWAQVIASTSSAILITNVFAYTNTNGVATTVSVGIGGAGAEVTVFNGVAAISSSTYFSTTVFSLPYPIRVAAGTRVAVTSGGASAINVGINYVTESAVL